MKSNLLLFSIGFLVYASSSCAANNTTHTVIRHTQCVTPDYCLCVNDADAKAINAAVGQIQSDINAAHKAGKLVVYLSIPFSGSGGSYSGLNQDVASDIKATLETRWGLKYVWVLNPIVSQPLPTDAGGADYSYLWSRVLYLSRSGKEGVDAVYFAGPADFARFLHLDGKDDFDRLAMYFDQRRKADAKFDMRVTDGSITKDAFIMYYGLEASVSFSLGAHDEWNIVQEINADRRSLSDGITKQLPLWFNGAPLAPPLYEDKVTSGHVGKCP